MCCGQSRAEYGALPDPARPPAALAPAWPREAPAAPAPVPSGGVRVRFTGGARVRVRGPATGADYVFSGDDPIHSVEAADVDGLLGTGYFRRAY
jgi:hypothetical protein